MALRLLFHLIILAFQNAFKKLPENISQVITVLSKTKVKNNDLNKIENYRKELLSNKTAIAYTEFGAGSRKKRHSLRNIKKLVRNATSSKRGGKFLYACTQYFLPKNIIELGTSFGLGAFYLAIANKQIKTFSIEGNKNLTEFANKTAQQLDINNILFITGHFDDYLENLLKCNNNSKCLIFIDGNHKKNATLKYFELCMNHCVDGSVIIIDDINWSKGMKKAWNNIIKHPKIEYSINYYYKGLLIKGNATNLNKYYSI